MSVHPGGGELIPGSPMDVLLGRIPQVEHSEDIIIDALRAYRPGPGHAAAQAAFAPAGDAVDRPRTEVYALLGLRRQPRRQHPHAPWLVTPGQPPTHLGQLPEGQLHRQDLRHHHRSHQSSYPHGELTSPNRRAPAAGRFAGLRAKSPGTAQANT
ncbi:hypothetical protein STRIP9103_05593 [Streptomyces ipomoeae 91-03]|uniref:Uncharacterized protein n=1 Tax=Streptomyces ipomoeae 91-03 TaxID=698759 RepID=L1KKW7_9ACTN|nr:hypothetical protein STRIP9103_05593 [Streptomyces ipomoeae 91-03]